MPKNYTDSLHPKTREYIQNTEIDKRKDLGQYFTPKNVCKELLSHLPDELFEEEGLDVLDPSSGTGEFLLVADDLFSEVNLEGWEIDEELADISQDILPESVNIKTTDSLFENPEKEYDVIIGNPPYYELDRTDKIEEHYEEVLYGRTNIYSLFIYKSLKLLKDGGYLAFVNPPSMNNGAYFKKLRKYIVDECSIEHISIHEDADIFEDASQPVMYFVVKKGGDHNDYVFSKNDITIFSEQAEDLKERFKGKKALSELGYEVRTGKLVWNQNKDKLSEEKEGNVPIIWSKNIVDGAISIGPDIHDKPQYIKNSFKNTGPAVVVNRIVGQPGSGSIRAALIKEGEEFVAENHVNVIQPKDGETQEISLTEILNQLNSDENVKTVQLITGNSQISKTELQELFPFEE